MKKIKCFILVMFLLLLVGCGKEEVDSDKLTIVSTSFPGYDFARAVVGAEDAELVMLIKPGSEVHSYDPSPKDIVTIQNSDVFIYVGGESERWVANIISSIDTSHTKVIRLMDYVDLSYEEVKEGMDVSHEEDEEYDEHIWTSPKNAMKLLKAIYTAISASDSLNEGIYLNNYNSYLDKITKLDSSITEIVNNSARKTIVFGDRFPFKYFVDEYDLNYFAAFPGCSSETEASAKTVAFLIDKVKQENIPVVFYLEMSNHKVADLIVEETNAKALEFHSVHNLTRDEFASGLTYVDVMNKNVSNLKEALN